MVGLCSVFIDRNVNLLQRIRVDINLFFGVKPDISFILFLLFHNRHSTKVPNLYEFLMH